jgi:isocitrate dehydrogenase (NAD+)
MTAVRQVLDAAGAQIDYEEIEVGERVYDRGFSSGIEPASWGSLRRTGVLLKAPITTPQGKGVKSLNVTIRKTLGLFANVRPTRSYTPYIRSKHENVDLVIVRENTEGLYSGLEHEVVPGVVESLKVVTRTASVRIAEYAFGYARRHGRKRVTTVHKANILKKSDGLFLECVREVALRYPDIERDEKIVDNTCMQLVMNPEQFDILLMENLYGDIVSDLAAGLVGGLGVVPGANLGERTAVFEAVHGSAPDIAGKNLANPTALLLSSCMMLEHLNEDAAATQIRSAIERVLRKGLVLTADLGGSASTVQFTDAIIGELTA